MTSHAVPVSPWERWGWIFAAVWLVFLGFPVTEILERHDSLPPTALGLGLVIAFGAVYLAAFGWLDDRPWPVFALLLIIAGGLTPLIGIEVIGLSPYLGVFSALQLPWPWWPRTTACIALLPLLSLATGDGVPYFFLLVLWSTITAMVLMRLFGEGQQRSDETRAALALVAERERVARDVHDVLGHSLTALSVKAELAARLIDLDPDRARQELESIQATARQALAEVRATVGGLRAGNLTAELAAAPLVLADAGVRTQLVGEVADTDPRHRVLLAWVLRESVTNVVRHARAGTVVIEVGPGGMTVTDDGAGWSGTEGNGLRGMRERVCGVGGTLDIRSVAPGTRVEVSLP